MCLFPRNIRNPTRSIARCGGQKLRMQVKCNECAECKKQKRLEWSFRANEHCKETFANGGFVVFMTLTYNDDNVPHLSDFIDVKQYGIADFMCFSSRDWMLFLKNMRRQLAYHWTQKNNGAVQFTYFLVSEYGTEEGKTHRPHYHVLFFVNDNRTSSIKEEKPFTPYIFSDLVDKCWTLGITDGYAFKGRTYFKEHVYGYDFGDKNLNKNALPACSYVSKYVTKDSSFQKEIDNRLKLLKERLNDDDYNDLKRNVSMYHRQSRGFGEYYLKTIDKDSYKHIFECGSIKYPQPNNVSYYLAIPQYYLRKLFYVTKKRADGTRFWSPTKLGLEFIEKRTLHSYDSQLQRFTNIYLNLDEGFKTHIQNVLNGRTLHDLARYCSFYYGRVRNDINSHSLPSYSLSSTEDTISSIMAHIVTSSHSNDLPSCDTFTRSLDNDIVELPLVYNNLFSELDFTPNVAISSRYEDYTSYDIAPIIAEIKQVSFNTFVKLYTYNDKIDPAFAHFDYLLDLFNNIEQKSNLPQQQYFDYLETLKQRFKQFNILTSK